MPIFILTVTAYIRHLTNLKNILAKANTWQEASKLKDEAVCNAHLAIDQFPLKKQVQLMCDYAKRGGAFLAGVTPPVYEDTEATLGDLVARIDKTITFLQTLTPTELPADYETKIIPLSWLPGKGLTTKYYVEEYAIPQFYFHYTTAYSILRNFGLPLGKGDFLGGLDIRDVTV